jgi:hypothetical protein
MNRYRLTSEASKAGVQAIFNLFLISSLQMLGAIVTGKRLPVPCSEIIPFKLDLDNSSERTKLLLDALPTPWWHADERRLNQHVD